MLHLHDFWRETPPKRPLLVNRLVFGGEIYEGTFVPNLTKTGQQMRPVDWSHIHTVLPFDLGESSKLLKVLFYDVS